MFDLGHIVKTLTSWRSPAAVPTEDSFRSQITGACAGISHPHYDVIMLHLVPGLDDKQRRSVCEGATKYIQQSLGIDSSVLEADSGENSLAVLRGYGSQVLHRLNSTTFQRLSFSSAFKAEIFMEQTFAAVQDVTACRIGDQEGVLLRFDPSRLPPDAARRSDFIDRATVAVRQLCDYRSVCVYAQNDSIVVTPQANCQYTVPSPDLLTILTTVVKDAQQLEPSTRRIRES